MIVLRIHIVSFNASEAAAVDQFLHDLADPGPVPTSWVLTGRTLTRRNGLDYEEITHRALGAQGNVMAGISLLEALLATTPRPDYVVFYGCAGAVDGAHVGCAFLVESASYVSLGTVSNAPRSKYVAQVRRMVGCALDAADQAMIDLQGSKSERLGPLNVAWPRERVTLKNKWLCETKPNEVKPLGNIDFESVLLGKVDLAAATGLETAHVAATDKVVTCAVDSPPVPISVTPTEVYEKREWTYGEALAFVQRCCEPLPLLIEMESYGIGCATHALRVEDRVVILRVVTDALTNKEKADNEQERLLRDGRWPLGLLIAAMVRAARRI